MSQDRLRGFIRTLAQPVTYLGIAILVFTYCALAYLLITDRKNAESDAQRRVDNLVRVLDKSFSHILQSADASLLFIRKSYEKDPSNFNLTAWVDNIAIKNDLTFSFLITDRNGRAIQSSHWKGMVGIDISDREYFHAQRDLTKDELFISKPLTLKLSGKLAVMLSRRITAPDGTFAGIAAILVDPGQLVTINRNVDLGPHGSMALVGLDGVLRTRSVNGEIDWDSIGRAVPLTPKALGRALQARSGHYWSVPGIFNDVRRLVSFRVLEFFPLIALVSISEASVYQHANESARIYLSIVLPLTAGILIAIGLGARRERKLIEAQSATRAAQAEIAKSRDDLARAEAMALLGHFRRDKGESSCIWSDGIYRIFGKSPSSFTPTSDTIMELVHPHDRPIMEQRRRDLAAGIEIPRETMRMFRDDGRIIYVESWSEPVRDSDGAVIGVFGTFQDVTASKLAEEALAQSKERYTLVENAVNDGLWDLNLVTGEVYLSPRWKDILGYALDELPRADSMFLALIHPADTAGVIAARRAHLEENQPFSLDFRLRCKSGEYRWMHARGKAMRDAKGRPVRMLGITTDISERKQAEEALRRSNERHRLVESAVCDGLWDWDIRTDSEYMSPRWKSILGYADDELPSLKATFFDLLHPDDKSLIVEMTRAHLEERKPYAADIRLRRKNGDYCWVHTRGAALYDDANRPIRMIGAITDITSRKQAEAEQAQLNQVLEARVAERTAALAQEMQRREEAQMKLAQVQKMEAVGQLTAGIAHDFNNLLAVIQGGIEFVQGAAARGLTAEPELIDAALRATRRGADLVQRLLSFSRLSPLQAEPTAVDQLVLDTLRLLQRTLGEQIEIEMRLCAGESAVSVDRCQLENALMNLALNARDAMPEGGRLTIVTTCGPCQWAAQEDAALWPTGEAVSIAVSDTGSGMTEEVRNRVFEPFFTTKPDGLGTGLGLSMVHGFVQQSGGRIEIDGAVGRGTTITIHLPRIEAARQSAEPSTAAGSSLVGREKTVLLVEDDPDVRIVTAARLKQLGCKVFAVANGNEAIDLIESPANIDVMLTDVVLPQGINGVNLIKEVMRARPGIGVLCMSGYDPTQTHSKWLDMQNIEFLEKPFSSARLSQVLKATLAA